MNDKEKIAIGGIYPGYDGKAEINPNQLTKQMLLVQGQEAYYATLLTQHYETIDGFKFEVTKWKAKAKELEEEIGLLVDRGLAAYDKIAPDFRKNKEVLTAYIKQTMFADKFAELRDALVGVRGSLLLAQEGLAKAESTEQQYKLVLQTCQNSINTGVNVLSWMKHESRNLGV